MATYVRSTCPCCGDVDLPATEVRLHVCSTDHSFSFLAFLCPVCAAPVTRHVTPLQIRLLFTAGIRPNVWPGPSWRPATAPPITEADVAAFSEAIQALPTAVKA